MKKVLISFLWFFSLSLSILPASADSSKETASTQTLDSLKTQAENISRQLAKQKQEQKKKESWFDRFQEKQRKKREQKALKEKKKQEGRKQSPDQLFREAKQLIQDKKFEQARDTLYQVRKLDPEYPWVEILLAELEARILQDKRKIPEKLYVDERIEKEEKREQAKREVEAKPKELEKKKKKIVQKQQKEEKRKPKKEVIKPQKKEKREPKKEVKEKKQQQEEKQDKITSEAQQLLQKGIQLEKLGQYSSAIEQFDQALKMDPKLKEAKQHRKIAQRKERQEAKAIYQRLKEKRKSEPKEVRRVRKEKKIEKKIEKVQKVKKIEKVEKLEREQQKQLKAKKRQEEKKPLLVQKRLEKEKRDQAKKKAREQKSLQQEQTKKAKEEKKQKPQKEFVKEDLFLLESAERAMKLKKYGAAIAAYEAVLRLRPDSKEAMKGLRSAQATERAEARLMIQRQLDSQGQPMSRKITAYFHDATLDEILQNLERMTGTTFVLPEEIKQDSQRRTVSIQEIPLEDALQEVLKDTEFAYAIKGQTVSIKRLAPITSH